ncbi:hypothetical protein ACFJIX_23580 [Roseateles sp. UC29_93]|uniref:hypothetical protein n=1 Tax=Roseateles sp. UC29_93 TaxID=3350177 RepID=UPI00366CC8E1
MDFRITADYHWESRIDKVLDEIQELKPRVFFIERSYGKSVEGVKILFNCPLPEFELKRRLRFSKKEKALYLDIMLDLSEMISADHAVRRKIMIDKLLSDVPETLQKYNFEDFDYERFNIDLKTLFEPLASHG